MATVGKLSAFDVESPQLWDTYASQVEFYCLANDITSEDKKRATLLAACGLQTLSILRSLIAPAQPLERSYDELTAVLKQYFNPRPSIIYQRYQFCRREQKEGETISVFLAGLRRLAEGCDFGTTLVERLRDQFVCGLRDESVQRRLLTEETLTLDAAVQRSLAAEAAGTQVREMHASGLSSSVDLIQHRRQFPTKYKTELQKHIMPTVPCCGCGGTHVRTECPFRRAKCHFCRKTGHIQRVCKARQQDTQTSSTQCMAVKGELDTDGALDLIYKLHSDSKTLRTTARVLINNTKCCMEVDSGSEYSIVSRGGFQDLCKGKPPVLEPVQTTLRDFQQNRITFMGQCFVSVKYGKYSACLRLLIAERACTNLLGREWFAPLGIFLSGVHSVRHSPMQDIIDAFPQVFSTTLGRYRGSPVSLPIDPKIPPIRLRARPLPLAMKPKVDAALDTLLKDGIIEPVCDPVWATPVVPIIKASGEVRLCGDYKVTVNQALRDHPYPIPAVHHFLASFPRSSVFAKIDLARAYLQLPVDEASADAQTIITHRGAFRVKRLQYGISVAPGIFQGMVDNILGGIQGVFPYFDDVLICATSDTDLTTKLRTVCSKLAACGLSVNKDKCVLGVSSIDFLGYTLDAEGLHPAADKVAAIRRAPTPTDKKKLQAFLGLLNFYSNFLPHRATTAEPLHKLLKADTVWSWTKEHERAFTQLKEALTSDDVLVPFDPRQQVVVTCDASPYGVGAVLSLKYANGLCSPVAFASRTLTKSERNYAQIDREALAIIFGVKHFHHFVYGIPFEIVTDHKPLLGIFTSDRPTPFILSPRMQRWACLLTAYNFRLQYAPGRSIGNADALSRWPSPAVQQSEEKLRAVLFLEDLENPPVSAEQIEKETKADPVLSRVKECILTAWPTHIQQDLRSYQSRKNELSTHRGCLLWGARVVIPTSLRPIVLRELHLGHMGIVRTKALARSYVWWPGMDQDIEQLIAKCNNCQEIRHQQPRAPTHHWEIPALPWSRIHVDYAGPIQGKMILVVVDAHSKWIDVREMPSTTTGATISALRELFATHGLPECIVSDNGPQFTAMEFTTFLHRNGIRHARVAPYHPSSNGLAERAVQSVKEGLQRLRNGTWSQRLARYLLMQHTTPSTATGLSPAELLFKRRIRTCLDFLHPDRAPQITQIPIQRVRTFQPQDTILTRRAGKNSPWIPAVIQHQTGPLSYEILTDSGIQKRHVDHLRPRAVNAHTEETAANQDSQNETALGEPIQVAAPTTSIHRESKPQTPSGRPRRVRRPPARLLDYDTSQKRGEREGV